MVATRPALMEEVKDLQELCELYISSHPNWNKKAVEVKPEPKAPQCDHHHMLHHAFSLINTFSKLNDSILDFPAEFGEAVNLAK